MVAEEKSIADTEKAKVEEKAERINFEVKSAEKKLAIAYENIKKVQESDLKELFS